MCFFIKAENDLIAYEKLISKKAFTSNSVESFLTLPN